MFAASIDVRLGTFCQTRGLAVVRRLGFGKDGTVWASSAATAIKVFSRSERYERERDVYARLAANGILQIAGHAVPIVLLTDDVLGVVEMTIVEPPFVLDFATAQLDTPFDFRPEIMAE
jgi:hypothetical protein